jgi:hypothetical protein
VAIASADTVAAMDTGEAKKLAGDPLLTGLAMKSGQGDDKGASGEFGYRRIAGFRTRDAYWGIGGLIAVGIAATVLATTLGSSDKTDETGQTTAIATNESAGKSPRSGTQGTPGVPTISPITGLERVLLHTEPAGAFVKSGHMDLGETPLEIPFGDGMAERLLSVSAKGYASQEIVLKRETASPHVVNLVKLAKKKRPKTSKTVKRTEKPATKGLETIGKEAIEKGSPEDWNPTDDDGSKLIPPGEDGETTEPKRPFLKKFFEKAGKRLEKRAERLEKNLEKAKKRLEKKPLMDMW